MEISERPASRHKTRVLSGDYWFFAISQKLIAQIATAASKYRETNQHRKKGKENNTCPGGEDKETNKGSSFRVCTKSQSVLGLYHFTWQQLVVTNFKNGEERKCAKRIKLPPSNGNQQEIRCQQTSSDCISLWSSATSEESPRQVWRLEGIRFDCFGCGKCLASGCPRNSCWRY